MCLWVFSKNVCLCLCVSVNHFVNMHDGDLWVGAGMSGVVPCSGSGVLQCFAGPLCTRRGVHVFLQRSVRENSTLPAAPKLPFLPFSLSFYPSPVLYQTSTIFLPLLPLPPCIHLILSHSHTDFMSHLSSIQIQQSFSPLLHPSFSLYSIMWHIQLLIFYMTVPFVFSSIISLFVEFLFSFPLHLYTHTHTLHLTLTHTKPHQHSTYHCSASLKVNMFLSKWWLSQASSLTSFTHTFSHPFPSLPCSLSLQHSLHHHKHPPSPLWLSLLQCGNFQAEPCSVWAGNEGGRERRRVRESGWRMRLLPDTEHG